MDYGNSISLAAAKKAIEAAKAEATGSEWNMVITVVDTGGYLIAMERMDGSMLGAIDVALSKARTAVLFKRETKAYENGVGAEFPGARLLSNPDICPFEGGIPLVQNDKIIGGIGVSGSHPSHDGQVARAGAEALG